MKIFIFCLFFLLSFFFKFSFAVDAITLAQSIRDGDTIVSAKESFELGFFSPGNSKNRFLGIWYKRIPIPTIVWVANRNTPITDLSGVLKFDNDHNLILVDRTARIFWSTNLSKAASPIAQLLDSGNLVVREEADYDPEDYLWQSFDYPTDTLLPGMKLGWNLKTGLDRFLTSWKNPDDPSVGDHAFRIDPHGFPQAFLMDRSVRKYRSGPWNGIRFSGVPELKPNYIFNFSFTFNEDEIYYSFALKNKSIFSRLVVNQSGLLQRFTWVDRYWNVFWFAPKDQCDSFKECGAYGICDPNHSPICKCVHGFEPKYPNDWYLRDGSGGCVRKTEFDCQKNDVFLELKGMKLPDSSRSFVDKSIDLKECEAECRKNCSCKAYANANVSNGGSGCVIWIDDLMDLREYTEGSQDLYIRIAASDLDSVEDGGKTDSTSVPSKKKRVTVIVTVTVIPIILLLGLGVCFIQKEKIMKNIWKRKPVERAHKEKNKDSPLFDTIILGPGDFTCENKDDLELPIFDLSTIAIATNNFSDENKLGQGGFGCVYKGTLVDGLKIAAKRLSRKSVQGGEEFKTEVRLIARLQHRNLVSLLGCCLEGEEKILVYEYMENKSLDSILFNRTKGSLLDWRKRFNIIVGVARGLLYLHQDSRFRIIHRDLKVSNILLDGKMNPKISDFGMARIFGGEQTEANTKKVVGTYGYMSPEYAMDGLFSTKSDVFSFGVLVLEIVSGKKNRGFYYSNSQLNLLGHAWRLWKEGRGLELMDALMGDSYLVYEVLRCIQMALLCVQERAEDRPTMSDVLLMLSSETSTLQEPKQPGYCLVSRHNETESSSNRRVSCTVNQVTVTTLEAR